MSYGEVYVLIKDGVEEQRFQNFGKSQKAED